MARWPIPRPTENAALRAVQAPAARPVEELFDGLVHAYAIRDRHGLQLFGLAVVRATDPTALRGPLS